MDPRSFAEIPRIAAEGGFHPPDFGGAHRPEPRLHMVIDSHYFSDTKPGYKNKWFIHLDFPPPFV
jgi:hypothetical protein